MKVIQKNAFVNIHTGERFDRIVGEGESVIVPQQSSLTPEQMREVREIERAKKGQC